MSEDRRSDLLSPIQHRAIDLLIEGRSRRQIAAEIRVDERTIYRWLATPEFRSEQRRLTDALREGAIMRSAARTETVLMVLESILADPARPTRARIAACRTYLDFDRRARALEMTAAQGADGADDPLDLGRKIRDFLTATARMEGIVDEAPSNPPPIPPPNPPPIPDGHGPAG